MNFINTNMDLNKKIMEKHNILKKPLFMLTGEEYLELLDTTKPKPSTAETTYIRGRTKLAKRLGVSLTTIIRWEEDEIIKPVRQIGRVLIYNLDEILKDVGPLTKAL